MSKKRIPWDIGKPEEPKQKELEYAGPCYHSHPPLPVGEHKIYGGNCGSPVHLDCDIYVALQQGSYVRLPDPWDPLFGQVQQVMFGIEDRKAPKNVERFKKMVDWLCNQLQAGKKIHVGCIGGHGRTGLVLSAVVRQMMPEVEDAIGYVRKNYCEKAVESHEQVEFLVQHYGTKAVHVTKKHKPVFDQQVPWPSDYSRHSPPQGRPQKGAWETKSSTQFKGSRRTIDPVRSLRNIFEPAT